MPDETNYGTVEFLGQTLTINVTGGGGTLTATAKGDGAYLEVSQFGATRGDAQFQAGRSCEDGFMSCAELNAHTPLLQAISQYQEEWTFDPTPQMVAERGY